MPLIFEKSKNIFLHIPKTGGSWLKQAIHAAGVQFEEFGDQHGNVKRMVDWGKKPEWLDDKFIFTIVRHPVTWYQSRWCFRVKHGWHGEHPLDMNCGSNHFPQFVENVLKFKPDGWVSWLYRNYNENPIHPTDFVGRMEFLVDDVIKAMHLAGEDFDEQTIRDCRLTNDSGMEGKSSKYWAKYTPELFDRVMAVEQDAITKYYPDFKINPDDFIGDCPYA